MKGLKFNHPLLLTKLIHVYFIILVSSHLCFAQYNARTEIKIPDIPGFVTLKCDFHMHTVFSDGNVWPSVRTVEAWREGLDAIAITDHIEYQPHEKDVPTNHNRSYELARSSANSFDILLIRAGEITRDMPPGHLNAILLQNVDQLDKKDHRDAIKNAVEQGGFVFWNHPGWTGQQPDGKSRWYDEHTELYDNGWLHGIEVVNGSSYYPEVHQWCLEKKLTMIGTSDIHGPTNLQINFQRGEHRTMTLVFAKTRNLDALKEALVKRRTAVYYKDILVGDDEFLRPIFYQSVRIKQPTIRIKGKGAVNLQIQNRSEIPYKLVAQRTFDDITIPKEIILHGDKTVLFRISGKLENYSKRKTYSLPYTAKNLLIAPEKGLPVEMKVTIEFSPAAK